MLYLFVITQFRTQNRAALLLELLAGVAQSAAAFALTDDAEARIACLA
jgi:hypothetical protein